MILQTSQYHIAIISSRFNEKATKKLASGAHKFLIENGLRPENVELFWVPGAWEIPYIANLLVAQKKYDAFICIGVIIQGDTDHHRLIADQCVSQMSKISLDNSVPFGNCVLTCHSMKEALQRAGGKVGHRGIEAAIAVLEVLNLRDIIVSRKKS